MNYVPAFYKRLPEGHVVIYNGKAYVFDILGNFTKEDGLLTGYVRGAVQANVLSVLSTRDYLELGVSIGKVFRSFQILDCSDDILKMSLYQKKGFCVNVTRSGEANGIRYSQGLFVYSSSVDVLEIIKALREQLGFKLGEGV